jgi:hypothetical protein
MKSLPEPVRVSLINLSNEQEMVVMANPEEFEEARQVNYHRHPVIGFSSQHHHFLGTDNAKFTTKFWHDLDVLRERTQLAGTFIEYLDFWRHLTVPRVVGGQVEGSPPMLLLVWPGTIQLICRLISFRNVSTEFNLDGSTRRYDTSVELEAVDFDRVSSQSYRDGWMR